MIDKEMQKALLRQAVEMLNQSGHKVREYGISHLLQSKINNDETKLNELCITIKYEADKC